MESPLGLLTTSMSCFTIGDPLLWSWEGRLCFKPNFGGWKLSGSLHWTLCWYCRCIPKSRNYDKRYVYVGTITFICFQTLSVELDEFLYKIDRKRLYRTLQQMLSSQAGSKADVLMEEYIKYKKGYVNRISSTHTSKTWVRFLFPFPFPAAMIEHAPLQSVYIYFDTATYDEIERDV